MAHFIHRVGTGNAARYRVWSTIVDAYLCGPLTRDEMAAHLVATLDHHYGDPAIEERLARADRQGTSGLGRTRATDDWDTERCGACGNFHHGYDARDDGTCSGCGEDERYVAHHCDHEEG